MRASAAAGIALVVGIGIAGGCRTPVPPPRGPQIWAPAPEERGQVQRWLARVRAERPERRGMRARIQLRVESERRSGSFAAVVLVERPRRLRFEALSPLGQTLTVLVVDGDEYGYYDGEAIERGRVAPDLLRVRLGLDVQLDEAVDLLLAAPAFPDQSPDFVARAGEERRADFGGRSLRFGAGGELHGVAERSLGGLVRWQALFRDWRDVDGGRYPSSVLLDFSATGVRTELQMREVELNPELAAALFRLPGSGAGGRG